jgi:hypothetical protein
MHVNVILSVITNSPTKLRSFSIHTGSAFGPSYKRRLLSDKYDVGMLYVENADKYDVGMLYVENDGRWTSRQSWVDVY